MLSNRDKKCLVEKQDFESIKESDLNELIEVQVPEGLRLDFKLTVEPRDFICSLTALLRSITKCAGRVTDHVIAQTDFAPAVHTLALLHSIRPHSQLTTSLAAPSPPSLLSEPSE